MTTQKVSSQTVLELARDLVAALEDAKEGDTVTMTVEKTSPDLFSFVLLSTAVQKPIVGQSRPWHLQKVRK